MSLQLGSNGPLVARWQNVMRERFKSYALAADGGPLKIDAYYGNDDRDVQKEYERRTKQVVDGIVSDHDLAALGLAKPVIFTVEGHLANMFAGPCAFTAKALEDMGVARWQPVGYDNVSLPFNNRSGIDELVHLMDSPVLPDGTPYPDGTPTALLVFSQGGIVGCRTFLDHIRPESGKLHRRLKDLKAVIAFGNPYREKNVCASWVPDPPKLDTQGISDRRMDNTPEFWREVSRTGDLYAENPDSEVGLNRSAVYKIVAESQWSGNPAGMWERVIDLASDPADGLIDIARAIAGGVKFITNMAPHGAYDLGPCVDFVRGRLA